MTVSAMIMGSIKGNVLFFACFGSSKCDVDFCHNACRNG